MIFFAALASLVMASCDSNPEISVVSGTKEHTGDVQHMRDAAIGLNKDIKECGVNQSAIIRLAM